jgi:hypothetical protein
VQRPKNKAELALALRVSRAAVSQWFSKPCAVPMERCPDVERFSSGELHCEVMRPDLQWIRMPDAAWPWHPKGRPLLDVSAPKSVPVAAAA